MKNRPLCLCIVLLLAATAAWSQPFKSDTSFVAAATSHAVKFYTNAIQGQAQLYNGSDYAEYRSLQDEHPYFGTDDWVYGTVFYDGYLYENVPLLYDISTDQLLTETYYSSSIMKLIKDKITYFTLPGKKFVNQPDTTISPGFYELLYDGKTKVYARHSKLLQETLSSQEIIHSFDEKTRYYIYKNNIYIHVKSKGSVLDVFGDRKREVSQYINKSKIRFRKNREQYITRLAEFYDRSQTNP
jgi:hypothetical protein